MDITPGGLKILWEEVSLSNRPILGIGIWNDETVLFCLAQDNSNHYLIHSLSENNLKIVTDEHTRFQEQIGYIRDYGKDFNIQIKKDVSSFRRGYNPMELDMKQIARIHYDQIINKFPNIIL